VIFFFQECDQGSGIRKLFVKKIDIIHERTFFRNFIVKE
jgi:hypothetical protein